jgi:hypothetical protein
MRTRRLVVAASLLVVPAIGYAQQTPTDSVPRAHSWGAEVFLGSGGTGASILRFQSPRFALLFGADFSMSHIDQTIDGGTSTVTQSNLGARFGVRSYRHSSAERLRPVIGFGARASYAKGSPDVRIWTTGVYGELGAMYFLTPHVSLGGTGELQASYGKRKQTTGIAGQIEVEQTTTVISASLMRVMLAVYF